MNLDKNFRQRYHDYRRPMDVRSVQNEEGHLLIEGTFVRFDTPYLLFKWGEFDVYETIDSRAFDGADYRDVPLKYNHGDQRGTPARTTSKNPVGRLDIEVYGDRVDMRANLLPTSGGKDLYLEIEAGTVPQMSWAFTQDLEQREVKRDEQAKRIDIIVRKVERLFDVAAVDFGANPDTSVYARHRGDMDDITSELDELERRRLRAQINIKLNL